MDGHEAIDELLADAGVDGLRLRGALALLSGGRWWTLADLVRETATSRRTIESLLRVLPLEHRGDHVRIPIDQVNRYNVGTDTDISGLGNPVAGMVAEPGARDSGGSGRAGTPVNAGLRRGRLHW